MIGWGKGSYDHLLVGWGHIGQGGEWATYLSWQGQEGEGQGAQGRGDMLQWDGWGDDKSLRILVLARGFEICLLEEALKFLRNICVFSRSTIPHSSEYRTASDSLLGSGQSHLKVFQVPWPPENMRVTLIHCSWDWEICLKFLEDNLAIYNKRILKYTYSLIQQFLVEELSVEKYWDEQGSYTCYTTQH